MKRKIVQHGCSSLTITLPHDWTEKYNIKKGDYLDVEIQGNNLIISTESDIEVPTKIIDTTEFGFFTKNNLTHLYQLGYDNIEIKYNNEKILREIIDRVPECIGFEIIDQKGNKIYVKSIADALETEFDSMLRKAFLITKELGQECLKNIETGNFPKLREIRHLEYMNNKFTMFCARILMKKGYKKPKRISQMYGVVKALERIADEYKYICDLLKDYKGKIDNKILKYFEEVNNYYNLFYEIFYTFDIQKKERIYTERKNLVNKGNNLLQDSKKELSLLLHHLLNIVTKTYDACGEYFALSL